MYQILLLHGALKRVCRIKDYLQLSGYDVVEGELDAAGGCQSDLRHVDSVILYCVSADSYFQICEKIRRMTPVPIVIISQSDDEWSKIRMFQAGADDYIVEPFSQGEFVARLKAHIVRFLKLTRPVDNMQFQDLEIDAVTRVVKVNGNEIFFRAKEFDLLWYMVQRPGKTITKQELYAAIWRDELGEGYFNCVSVHIKRIRQKIEKDPDNPKYLETVWGVGYRFAG